MIIGHPPRAAFILLPREAVEVLDDLASGLTVGEAQARHVSRYGEAPDMEDFLGGLDERGFIRPRTEDGNGRVDMPPDPARDFHFEWLSPQVARRLCGRATLVAVAALVGAALGAMIADPSIVPGWRAVYFPRHTTTHLLTLMLLGLLTTLFHELGHLIAARAEGVSCRFGVSNQLWFLVWETDMTGVWALPRRRRYLPILGGPLIDVGSAAALLLVCFTEVRGWLALAPPWSATVRGLLFIYLMRLVWQCYFFLRTDFYYAAANALGCTNLMQDTRDWLAAWAGRLVGRRPFEPLAHLSARERSVVQLYSGLWLAGRIIALSVLVFVQLPLLMHYMALIFERLRGSGEGQESASAPLLTAVTFVVLLLTGLVLWLRQLQIFERIKRWSSHPPKR